MVSKQMRDLKHENFSTLGVKRKIMLMVSLVVTFAILTTVGPIMVMQSDRLFTTYQEKTEVAVLALTDAFAQLNKRTFLAGKMVASLPGLAEAIEAKDQQACWRILIPVMAEEGMDFGTITDENGVVIIRAHAVKAGDNTSDQFAVRQALAGIAVSTVESTPATPLSIRSSIPVTNSSGRVLGTVSLSIDGTRTELVDNIKRMHGVEATIFAGETRVNTTVAMGEQRAVGTKASADIVETVLRKGADFTGRANVNGLPFVASYKPIRGPYGEPVGMLFTGKSLQSYYADRNHQLRIVAGLALGILSVCLLFAYWLAETLYSPLVQGLNQYKNENKKLNQLMNLCPVGIVLFDAKGIVSAINGAYTGGIPDFKKENFLGKSGQYLVEAAGLTWESSASYSALKGRETLNSYQKNPRGTFLISSVPIRAYEKNIISGAMSIVHDITKYEELKEKIATLDRRNLVAEMAAGVAHEIRNPMTVIKGYLQLMSEKASDRMLEQFRIVLAELARIEQIISDFLCLAGNKLSAPKKQSLHRVIEGVLPLIQADALQRGIDVKVNLTRELPDLFLNDQEIKQLLLNLTRNGMEAMSQQGVLTIETSVTHNMVCLCIADSGCGIPPELQAKIFAPFFTTKSDGTGLGLAVCAGIVRRHNATIEVQSKEGAGTKFLIIFDPGSTLDA